MANGSEMGGFVFSVMFIIVFATFVSTIPAGLQGPEETPTNLIPVDPSILTDFSSYENYSKNAFTPYAGAYSYEYPSALGGFDFICFTDYTEFTIGAKVYLFGVFWLGQIDLVKFTSNIGSDRGLSLNLTEMDSDMSDGNARYNLQFSTSGHSAGSLIVFYNTTSWNNATHAFDNDELYFVHGIGLGSSATNDIGALIISLLFFQLPEVPALINTLIVGPVWVCIIYVLWYIVKEMIPFV